MWERGLKLAMFETRDYGITVAPLVGAWIEISIIALAALHPWQVAPLVGAWIEISRIFSNTTDASRSLPLWERGLKFE